MFGKVRDSTRAGRLREGQVWRKHSPETWAKRRGGTGAKNICYWLPVGPERRLPVTSQWEVDTQVIGSPGRICKWLAWCQLGGAAGKTDERNGELARKGVRPANSCESSALFAATHGSVLVGACEPWKKLLPNNVPVAGLDPEPITSVCGSTRSQASADSANCAVRSGPLGYWLTSFSPNMLVKR